MPTALIKARIMFKLVRKNNWGNRYDRLEHFKRFPDLDKTLKELARKGWIIVHKKQKYTAISLNTKYKGEIVKFIENNMPYLKETKWVG